MYVYITYWFFSLCTSIFIKKRIHVIIFFIISFIFIGLRFETGFDWPIYKYIFETFSNDLSIYSFDLIQSQYSQDNGFLLITAFLSQALPNYQVTQAFYSFIFLYSFLKISDAITGSRPALSLAIYFSFFLLPVGFSTVRQALSISLFNICLALFMRKKSSIFSNIFLSIAVILVQATGVFYVLSLFVAYIMGKKGIKIGINNFIILSIMLTVGMPFFLIFLIQNFSLVGERILYYNNTTLFSDLSNFNLIFALLIFLSGAFVIYKGKNIDINDYTEVTLYNLIIILCLFSFASVFFLTLRDRILYEYAIIFVIYVTRKIDFKSLIALFAFVALGIFYQLAILRPPQNLAFIPYQNYILMELTGEESSGEERSSLYLEEFKRNTEQ